MERTAVTSSAIKSIGHQGDVLEVEMVNGKIYTHHGITADHHAEMLASESIGRHYNTVIKKLSTGRAYEPPPPTDDDLAPWGE